MGTAAEYSSAFSMADSELPGGESMAGRLVVPAVTGKHAKVHHTPVSGQK